MATSNKKGDEEKNYWQQTLTNVSTPIIPFEFPPLIKHKNRDFLQDGSNFFAMVGESGCGKTGLLRILIPMFNIVSLIICTLIQGNAIHHAIFEWATRQGIDTCIVHDRALAEEACARARARFKRSGEDPRCHTLLFMDDFSKYRSGCDEELNNFAITALSTFRNDGFSIGLATQNYGNIPTKARSSLNDIFVFPFGDFYGLQQLKHDLLGRTGVWNMKKSMMGMTQPCASAPELKMCLKRRNRAVSRVHPYLLTNTIQQTQPNHQQKNNEHGKSQSSTTQRQTKKDGSYSKMSPQELERKMRENRMKYSIGTTVQERKSLPHLPQETKSGSGAEKKENEGLREEEPPQRTRRGTTPKIGAIKDRFEDMWCDIWDYLEKHKFNFCLFKKPGEVYMNFDRIF